MKNKELAKLIDYWYLKNSCNPSKWSDNIVGLTIKDILTESGNWKNKARGKPDANNFNK